MPTGCPQITTVYFLVPKLRFVSNYFWIKISKSSHCVELHRAMGFYLPCNSTEKAAVQKTPSPPLILLVLHCVRLIKKEIPIPKTILFAHHIKQPILKLRILNYVNENLICSTEKVAVLKTPSPNGSYCLHCVRLIKKAIPIHKTILFIRQIKQPILKLRILNFVRENVIALKKSLFRKRLPPLPHTHMDPTGTALCEINQKGDPFSSSVHYFTVNNYSPVQALYRQMLWVFSTPICV